MCITTSTPDSESTSSADNWLTNSHKANILKDIAHEIYQRVYLLIENLSMTVLVNFHVWALESRGADGAPRSVAGRHSFQ